MLRVFVSVALLVVLTTAYVVNPFAGWVALASTFGFLAAKRAKKVELSPDFKTR